MAELNVNANDFLFGGIDAKDQTTMSVFDKKETNLDGIYRPKLEECKDKKIGYRSTLRFLPNLTKEGKLGPSAIEKHVHYFDGKGEQGLSGYYDCNKNFTDNCPMCTMYWKLKNSKNQADVEKAALISRTTKYYSYVLIIEDEQKPDLVGKILVFPFGYTIKEKINSERNGDVSGIANNIFDVSAGKEFKLIIKEKGGFQNYESSQFMEVSPIKIFDAETSKFKTAPIDADGKISNDKAKKKITEFLLSRDVDINDHQPKEWDEEIKMKVDNVLAILSGQDITFATNTSKKPDQVEVSTPSGSITEDDFFDFDESDDTK